MLLHRAIKQPWRSSRVVVVACFAAALLALPALADAASTVSAQPKIPGTSGAHLTLSGDAGRNVVTVTHESSYFVSDASGIVSGAACTGASPTVAHCETFGNLVQIDLFGGGDNLVIDGPLRSRSQGYGGSDTVYGAQGHDNIGGGAGNDVLFGRRGPDTVSGQDGHDRLIGGPGDDHLFAHEGQSDLAIRCGPGEDKAIVDRRLDPKPVGCERVGYVYPPIGHK